MRADGFTYTTISSGPGKPTRVDVSLCLDSSATIRVTGAGTDRAFLSIADGDTSIRIVPGSDALSPVDASVARRIADQAVLYADEIDRICRAQQASVAAA